MILGNDEPAVKFGKSITKAEVLLKTSADSNWTPGIMKAPGEMEVVTTVRFKLIREDGNWRIAGVPEISLPPSQ